MLWYFEILRGADAEKAGIKVPPENIHGGGWKYEIWNMYIQMHFLLCVFDFVITNATKNINNPIVLVLSPALVLWYAVPEEAWI